MTTPRIGSLGILSATGNMLFRDGSGNLEEVDTSAASNGDVLEVVGGLPAWVTPSSAEFDFTLAFSPADAIFAAINSQTGIAGVLGRNNHPTLTFIDTAAAPADNENAVFAAAIPKAYESANSIQVQINWVATSAIAGDVKWDAAFEFDQEGVYNLAADSFAAARTTTDTTDGTSGVITRTTIDFTTAQADGVVAGSSFRLQIVRDANDGGDTMVGDAEVIGVNIIEI